MTPRDRRALIILGVIVVVAAAAYFLVLKKSSGPTTALPTPTQTSTGVPTPSPEPSVTVSPTPRTTTPPPGVIVGGRDPFSPLVGVASSGGGGPTGPTGPITTPPTSPTTTPPTSPSVSPPASPPPTPVGGTTTVIGGHTVTLIDIFHRNGVKYAQVSVGGQVPALRDLGGAVAGSGGRSHRTAPQLTPGRGAARGGPLPGPGPFRRRAPCGAGAPGRAPIVLAMLRFLTAGESHGPSLVAVLEGLPAGVPVSLDSLGREMARRRHGYGRSGRQRMEGDRAQVLGGVRHGRTLGSPVAVTIENAEWATKYRERMGIEGSPDPDERLTRPRPGHADLAGMQKFGFDDARNVLERASARETAARVAAGYFCKAFLGETARLSAVWTPRRRSAWSPPSARPSGNGTPWAGCSRSSRTAPRRASVRTPTTTGASTPAWPSPS